MALTYYHNPRCSKSRLGLELLTKAQAQFDIVLYLDEPLSPEKIETVIKKYLKTDKSNQLKDLIRTKDDEFKTLANAPAVDDISAWAQLIANSPKILERPLLVGPKACILGRPPEELLSSPDLL